jgi:Family of unknown function (DUF6069)
MSPTTTHQPPATQTARRLRRLAAVLIAVIAAVVLWAIAVHAAGIDLRSPGFGHSQKPAALNPGTVAVVSGLAGLAAWGLLALLERSTQRPRQIWTAAALIALVVSLGAPLSGHGVSDASRGILACLHVLVAVTLIVLLGRTAAAGRGVPRQSQHRPGPAAADATPEPTSQRS